MGSWDRIERAVAAVAPNGLRPGASPEDLDALGIPAPWRALWERHDGQSDDITGVFEGWYFLPLRGIESVEAESYDDRITIAKDFGGGTWSIDADGGRLIEDLDGERTVIAKDLDAFLLRIARALERSASGADADDETPMEPLRRLVVGEDGRPALETERVIRIRGLHGWPIGEARPLGGHGIIVRIAPPPPGPLPGPPFAFHYLAGDPNGAQGNGHGLAATIAQQLPGFGASSGRGGTVVYGPAAPPSDLELLFRFDSAKIPAITLLRDADAVVANDDAAALSARGAARALLGRDREAIDDLRRALEAGSCGRPDLLVDRLLAVQDMATLAQIAPRLEGATAVRALLAVDPASAADRAREAYAHLAADRAAELRLWRALALERVGDPKGAFEETDAVQRAPPIGISRPALQAVWERRRAVAAKAPPPRRAATEPSNDVLSAIARRSADVWEARIEVRPQHGGALVEIDFAGDRRAIRLPTTLRHGMTGTLSNVAPDGATLRIEVAIC